MPSAVSKATISSQPDYHIVSVRLAACDEYPETNSDQTTRAAVYSFQSVAERSNSSSSSHLFHQHASGGGGGGQAPNPALVTSVGEWIMQRVIETPEWLIRIVRRSLEDATRTTTTTKNKSNTQTATTITSSTPLPEAVLLSSGLGRDLVVLLSEHARPPRNLADIPRVGIAASVLDINDMIERGNKTESDIIAENGTISPGDYLFEHIDYAKKMMKRSKNVFLYLTTEKHHFKRKKSETDVGGRPYVYRLFMRGPFSEENTVLEQVTYSEKEWLAKTDGNGSPGTFDEEEAEDEEPHVGEDENEDDRIDMLIHAGENSASSQGDDDGSSDAGDPDGDDEKEATAAAKRLQHLSQAASTRSNSNEEEEEEGASSTDNDGDQMEDQEYSRGELRDKKVPAKASTARRVETSVDEEEYDDDDSDEDAMAEGTNKGNVDESVSVSEEEEEVNVEIYGEDDDDDNSADYAAFTPREIIYLSRIFRGGSIPAKELKWGDMKKVNKKDILFARRVVKKLLRRRKRPKQARKPSKKVQQAQVPGNEEGPVPADYGSNVDIVRPMMVPNDDSRDEANESRASLPSSANIDPPSTEVRELHEVKNDLVALKPPPPKRDVDVAAAGVSGDISLPKVPLMEQAGDAVPFIRNQAESAEEPVSVGNQQAADDDTKKKQGRPKEPKNKTVSKTDAMDVGTKDARTSLGKDNQAGKKGSMPKAAKDGDNEELEGSKTSSSEEYPAQGKASDIKPEKEGETDEKLDGSKPTHDHVRPDDKPEKTAEAGPVVTSKGPSHAQLDPSDVSKAQGTLTAESKEQQEQVDISKSQPQVLGGTSHASSAPDKASNVTLTEPVSAPAVPQSLSQTKPAEPQESTAPVDNPKGEESSKKRGRPKGSKNKKKDEEGEEGASKKRKKKDKHSTKEKPTKKEKRESKKQKTSHAAPDTGVGPKESTNAARTSASSVEEIQSVTVGESAKHSSEVTKSKNKEREKSSKKKSEHGTRKDDHDASRQEVAALSAESKAALSAESKSSPREGESGSS